MQKIQTKKVFTFLKIFLIITAISVLAVIMIFAINPSKQLGDTRNSQRRSDVMNILNAVYQYKIENDALPISISSLVVDTPTEICQKGGNCAGLVDLTVLYVNEKYIKNIPADPKSATDNSTRYSISRSINNRITVTALDPENNVRINVTR